MARKRIQSESSGLYVSAAQRRVLEVLKMRGGTQAGDVAEALGMTTVSAREHLATLESREFVTQRTAQPVGRGRPATLWSLTDQAEAVFPNGHAELTVGLLNAMREAVGEKGVLRIIETRAIAECERYLQFMPGPSASLRKRIEALAALRTRDGYMAEVEQEKPGQYLLIENHCPICEAAKTCVGLCHAELEVFQRVLGEDVHIERTEHQLNDGERRCVYRVRKE